MLVKLVDLAFWKHVCTHSCYLLTSAISSHLPTPNYHFKQFMDLLKCDKNKVGSCLRLGYWWNDRMTGGKVGLKETQKPGVKRLRCGKLHIPSTSKQINNVLVVKLAKNIHNCESSHGTSLQSYSLGRILWYTDSASVQSTFGGVTQMPQWEMNSDIWSGSPWFISQVDYCSLYLKPLPITGFIKAPLKVTYEWSL